MDRSENYWLWTAATSVIIAAAFLGISAATTAGSHPPVDWKTTWEAYVAYGLFAIAALCVLAAGRAVRFPLVPQVAMTFVGVNVKPPMSLLSNNIQIGYAVYAHTIISASAVVENVKGEIIRLEQRNSSGHFSPAPDFKAPHELRWDKPYQVLADALRTTIYPDTAGRLNLANTESLDAAMTCLCVPRHAPGMGLTKLVPGDYRLTVRISAPGAKSADAKFLIHAGEWNELGVEMVRP